MMVGDLSVEGRILVVYESWTVWYGVGKGESKKEPEGSTDHLYHSICTTSHATGSSPSLQAQRSWWTIGKPKSSAHVTISSSRGRAHTHRSLRGEARKSRSANDVVVCSWEVYVPRHTAKHVVSFRYYASLCFEICVMRRAQDRVPQWETSAKNISHVGIRRRRAIHSPGRTVVY